VWIELELPRGKPAVVAIPAGANNARPVVVAAHGAGDVPRWYCEVWRQIVAGRGFVVCPRGYPIFPHVPNRTGYFYDGHPSLGREIADSLAALQARFGEYVDVRDPLFIGYSQGANMGSLVLPDHSARFAGALLIEGGVGEFQEWNIATAKRFQARGARRTALLCGRLSCASFAHATARYFRLAGLETRVDHVAYAGHTYRDRVAQRSREVFEWLVADDTRW